MSNINLFPIKVQRDATTSGRTCGECTKCCEGYLEGEVHGRKFYLGNPCFLLKKEGCSIYPDRPEKPCKAYSCHWLQNAMLPDHLRPDKSSVILTEKIAEGQPYLQAVEAGKIMDSTFLAELINYVFINGFNLEYQVNRRTFYIGSSEFMAKVNSHQKTKIFK